MSNILPVDLVTGEILSDTHYVRSHKQAAVYKQIKERKGRSRDFTFTDMECIKEVIKGIRSNHCGYLLFLQCFIDYEGKLVTPSKVVMDKDAIQDALGLGRSAFYKFFKEMEDNHIIYEVGGVYYVNNKYHFKGSSTNQQVIKSFTFKVRRLYKENRANDLGFIYKLLPFVHLKTNTICDNPYEVELDRIRYLSKKGIEELTGESEKTVYNRLRRMKIDGEYVFAEIRVGRERFYKINPFLFYRRQGEPDASLREIFLLGFGNNL